MELRKKNLDSLHQKKFDVLIIGGGINGAVAFAALAAKGVKVALVDKGDFAGMTSSNSSNLAWGGIKYLESYELLLVNRLCQSRNELMRSFPSTVKEIRFFTTIQRGFRFPAFFVFLGTILYWIIGRFFTKSPRYIPTNTIESLEPVINTENTAGGFEYSDCFLHDNDARFVFNFVRSGLDKQGTAANYVNAHQSRKEKGSWCTQATDTISGDSFDIHSKIIINACGPYVDHYNHLNHQKTQYKHLFSKGIHLIVDRITDSEKVLTFFASDGRLFFVIPMGPKTCVGTTDTPVESPVVSVTNEDRDFVLENINRLLDLPTPLTADDVISERCGVRPLAVDNRDTKASADWVKLSRKHEIDINTDDKYISIFGGKLTDCLNVGDEVASIVADLGVELTESDSKWYGEASNAHKDTFLQQARAINLDAMTDPSSSEPLSIRLWRRYGIHSMTLLEQIQRDPKQAELLIENAEYIRCEVELASRLEMITKLEDFLRRRSKIEQVIKLEDILSAPGLRDACQLLFGDDAEAKLQEYIESKG
ncbi:MAG: glycerol-3-phosphate dehydrogenase/oxidase [Oceanicoccus sp.]